jgi:oligoendopeptidase F
MISALYLVENIIPKEPERYLNFLKSGARKSPVELLFDAGVDLKKKQTFENAFNAIKSIIKNWEKLL